MSAPSAVGARNSEWQKMRCWDWKMLNNCSLCEQRPRVEEIGGSKCGVSAVMLRRRAGRVV